jgi:hypothetical protein
MKNNSVEMTASKTTNPPNVRKTAKTHTGTGNLAVIAVTRIYAR